MMLQSSELEEYREATSALTDYKWRHKIPQRALLDIVRRHDSSLAEALRSRDRSAEEVRILASWLRATPWFVHTRASEAVSHELAKRVRHEGVGYRSRYRPREECCAFVFSGTLKTQLRRRGEPEGQARGTLGKLGPGEILDNEQLLFSCCPGEMEAYLAGSQPGGGDAAEDAASSRSSRSSSSLAREQEQEQEPPPCRQRARGDGRSDQDLVVEYTALEASELAVVSRADYDALMRAADYESLRGDYWALKRFFLNWSTLELARLVRVVRFRRAPLGSHLVDQGDRTEAVVLLRMGLCRVVKFFDRLAATQGKLDAAQKELDELRHTYVYHYSLRSKADPTALDRIEVLKLDIAAYQSQIAVFQAQLRDPTSKISTERKPAKVGILLPPGLCSERCLTETTGASPWSVIADTPVEYYTIHASLFEHFFHLDEHNTQTIRRRARYREIYK